MRSFALLSLAALAAALPTERQFQCLGVFPIVAQLQLDSSAVPFCRALLTPTVTSTIRSTTTAHATTVATATITEAVLAKRQFGLPSVPAALRNLERSIVAQACACFVQAPKTTSVVRTTQTVTTTSFSTSTRTVVATTTVAPAKAGSGVKIVVSALTVCPTISGQTISQSTSLA